MNQTDANAAGPAPDATRRLQPGEDPALAHQLGPQSIASSVPDQTLAPAAQLVIDTSIPVLNVSQKIEDLYGLADDLRRGLYAEGEAAYQRLRKNLPKMNLSELEAEELRYLTHRAILLTDARVGATAQDIPRIEQGWKDVISGLKDIEACKRFDAVQVFRIIVGDVFRRAADLALKGLVNAAAVVLA